MALLARLGEIRRAVIGIVRTLIVLQVTGHTGDAGKVVIVVDVAIGTLPRRDCMPSGQRKSHGAVIEVGREPAVGAVARVAGCGELRLNVVGIHGSLEIRRVAGIALSRRRLKLGCGRAFVAGIAIDGRMRSSQREAIVVLLYLRNRNLPSTNRVALFAICSQLPAVNVRVAILTALPNIRKDRLCMASRASHCLVHAAERIASLIMIKLGNRTHRPPCIWRMTVLAWNGQISVRTMSDSRSLPVSAAPDR